MIRNKKLLLFLILTSVVCFVNFSNAQKSNSNDDATGCDFKCDNNSSDCSVGKGLEVWDDHGQLLSRKKRDFGGKEPIDWVKTYNAVFGTTGWMAQACEAFSDINFHLLGYNVLALVYNFGEKRKNPDKVRQKYLDQFFGPTAIAGSALRAFRNPFFAFTVRSWYDLVFHTKNMTEVLSKAHISAFRDTILSEPWLHAKIFRDVCSFFFTSIGWTTYYVWWKWWIKQPIIAGKRKKRSTSDKDVEGKMFAELLEKAYANIVKQMEERERKTEEYNFVENDYYYNPSLAALHACGGANSTCLATAGDSKAFGDYQYYMSFGGDQYFDLNRAIDAIYGASGLLIQTGHWMSQTSYEVAGYTAIGFMYNTFYRTMIEDNEARKFIDTFVGPSVSMASILRITRNATFSLFLRITLCLFLPLTREKTLNTFRFFTWTALKNIVFAEVYLHQRIWRHVFENGLGLIGLSTYYIMFKYKKAYLDPPPEKKPATTPAPKDGSTTAKPNDGSTTKKPAYKRKDGQYPYYDESNGYNDQPTNSLYGYVPSDEANDSFYSLQEPVYDSEAAYNNQASFGSYVDPLAGYNYNNNNNNYNTYIDEPPQVENKFLNSFKSILSRLKDTGNKEDWSPVPTYSH